MNFLWVFFSGLYLALLRHQANLTTCQSLNTLYESEKCCSVMSDSLWPYGLQPTRLLCPWASPGKNTGAGCHALLQRIFLIQESNLSFLRLLHQQAGSLPLAPPGKSLYSCTSHLCSGIAFLLYLSRNLIMPSQILNVTTSKRSSLFTLDFFPNTHLISYIPDQTIWDWSFYRSRVVICWQFLMKQTKPEFSALYKVSICLINICLKWVSEHFNENKQYSP